MPKEEKTIDRLKNQLPYTDEEGKVTEEKPEEEEVRAEPKAEGEEDKAPVKTTDEEEKELPKEAKERTKEQFEKLKESNKKLKEENDKVKEEARKFAKEGVVSSLIPDVEQKPQAPQQYDWNKMTTNQLPPSAMFPNLTQKDVKSVFNDLVDSEGYVNSDLLKESLENANKQIEETKRENQRLKQEIQSARRSMDDFQRSQIAREVHKKYPELNPDSEEEEFNPAFFEAVRDKMIANLAKGLPEDFMGSATALYGRYKKVKKSEKEEQKKQQDAIAQINATGDKGSAASRNYGDHEELVKAVQQGKKGALAERLKRSGF